MAVILYNNFFLYRSIPYLLYDFYFLGHKGLTANWKEAGLHYTGDESTASNDLLIDWRPEYEFLPDEPVKLDIDGRLAMM